MELSVNSDGIGLFIECVEIDEDDSQSMRYNIKLDLDHPTGKFTYFADDIWLETDMWDCFELNLKKGIQEKAVFHDQSNYFEISLVRDIKDIELGVKVREPLINGGETSFSSTQRIELDSGFISALIRSFNEYPKYW